MSKSIREIIKNHVEYNLWNTYLLVLVDINLFNEKYYYVERDVRNLRKYVIQNEKDISRIPFINMAEHKIDNDGVKGHSYSPSVQI
ncbi:ABC-three component system middle component 1, partial [Streptococcus pneumoniae]|uniref:ABC-three component system middle component 1 n=1 Tax=Streptococcus pneumoniae TaxID=1313 RepID=UPI002E7B8727